MRLSGSIVALCVIAITSNVQAQVIGDFEGTLESGWVVAAGTGAPSTVWSSTGSYSLRLVPSENGFAWALRFDDVSTVQKLADGYVLKADVYWDSGEWLPDEDLDAWALWGIIALNSAGGWQATADANMVDPANPSHPGVWDPHHWGSTHQRTITWKTPELGYDATGTTWGQLHMSYNFGNADTIGAFYIDNIRLVPEPSSLVLLGIAGARLAIRRRRLWKKG